jgi:hypothetical protein
MMTKFQVAYNGKVLGYENADTKAEALSKLTERNPHHLPECFELTALEPVLDKGAVVAHRMKAATNPA